MAGLAIEHARCKRSRTRSAVAVGRCFAKVARAARRSILLTHLPLTEWTWAGAACLVDERRCSARGARIREAETSANIFTVKFQRLGTSSEGRLCVRELLAQRNKPRSERILARVDDPRFGGGRGSWYLWWLCWRETELTHIPILLVTILVVHEPRVGVRPFAREPELNAVVLSWLFRERGETHTAESE
jgi:hypothetical protein